jgi:hypothetical protein
MEAKYGKSLCFVALRRLGRLGKVKLAYHKLRPLVRYLFSGVPGSLGRVLLGSR